MHFQYVIQSKAIDGVLIFPKKAGGVFQLLWSISYFLIFLSKYCQFYSTREDTKLGTEYKANF